MQPEVPESIPGVDDKQLAAVASLLPSLPNVRAEAADRFAQAIRALVESRAQDEWPNEGEEDVAVFVMVDRPRQVGEKHGAHPFADLIAKEEPILGRLFLTNRDASGGRFMQMPVTDPNAILEWLDDNDLAGCPLVIAYRKSKTMVTRRAGIGDLARRDPIRDHPPSATLGELLAALEHFHINRLLTPTCCSDGVWEQERANQYIPGPRPEKSIQSDLELALNFWFRGVVKAEHEDKTNIGRIDVRLLKRSDQGGPLAYWAIIELKVIKSFTNAPKGSAASKVQVSDNVAAIIEGIKQAWAFRQNREADEGLLEIFDLRKDKGQDLMQHADVTAVMVDFVPVPTHHVRPLFGSSGDARDAGFTGS